MKRFVFSTGDINGIGPEIVINAVKELSDLGHKYYITGPVNLLTQIADENELHYDVISADNIGEVENNNNVHFIDIGEYKQDIGVPTKFSGEAAFKSILTAVEIIKRNNFEALITAPISKEAFKFAGINFPGHTELLASETSTDEFAMMFLSDNFKCMLATIHIPLKDVAATINKKLIINKINLINRTLQQDFGIKDPRIAVLGLNPHSGENGNIGVEEKEIIVPALEETANLRVDGPFVPDAFFGLKQYEDYDCVLAMYHDQALIPFKLLNFELGVNYTAGLPIIRTSPDHGTAFNIAGKNKANYKSILEAVRWAELISDNRKKFERQI